MSIRLLVMRVISYKYFHMHCCAEGLALQCLSLDQRESRSKAVCDEEWEAPGKEVAQVFVLSFLDLLAWHLMA